MKLLLALVLLLPSVTWADEIDPNMQDRINDAICGGNMFPTCPGYRPENPDAGRQPRQWTYYCHARDYGRRLVQGTPAAKLRQAQRSALRICQTLSGRVCRLARCYRQ